jgi:hypothetical protein
VPSAAADQPAAVPQGLVADVVELVGTGPVLLGGYTLAELVAVDAVVDFLETTPSADALGEAVRSLVARQLLVRSGDGDRLHVRGDLGIALAFQQRARSILDARVTGTQPGEPWRMLVLPQPEVIALEVAIDALGVHSLALRALDDVVERLAAWLPGGEPAESEGMVDAGTVLPAASRTALLTATVYTSTGSDEVAQSSTDVVLAALGDQLHAFTRDPQDAARLVTSDVADQGVELLLRALLSPG